jgi:hypothetical protein
MAEEELVERKKKIHHAILASLSWNNLQQRCVIGQTGFRLFHNFKKAGN